MGYNIKVKVLITVGIVLLVGLGYYLIEPTLADDVVNEEIAVDLSSLASDRIEETTVERVPREEKGSEDVEEVQSPSELYQGSLSGHGSYRASGQVYISRQDLSLVNLDSTNVPDGRVYLASDREATTFIDLGPLKGNQGNQNYRLPQSYDTQAYPYVLIWCRAFSTLVGSAELSL